MLGVGRALWSLYQRLRWCFVLSGREAGLVGAATPEAKAAQSTRQCQRRPENAFCFHSPFLDFELKFPRPAARPVRTGRAGTWRARAFLCCVKRRRGLRTIDGARGTQQNGQALVVVDVREH